MTGAEAKLREAWKYVLKTHNHPQQYPANYESYPIACSICALDACFDLLGEREEACAKEYERGYADGCRTREMKARGEHATRSQDRIEDQFKPLMDAAGGEWIELPIGFPTKYRASKAVQRCKWRCAGVYDFKSANGKLFGRAIAAARNETT